MRKCCSSSVSNKVPVRYDDCSWPVRTSSVHHHRISSDTRATGFASSPVTTSTDDARRMMKRTFLVHWILIHSYHAMTLQPQPKRMDETERLPSLRDSRPLRNNGNVSTSVDLVFLVLQDRCATGLDRKALPGAVVADGGGGGGGMI